MSELQPQSASGFAGAPCGICQTGIEVEESVGTCPACQSPFHAECWAENGGCAQYGCVHMPSATPAETGVSARTYWGREEKACTGCGEQIKVAALRCRFCGEVFATEQPMTAVEADSQSQSAERRAAAGTAALWLFIAGLVPCTAPLTLVVGGIWYSSNRAVVRQLPSQRRVLALLGLGASAVTTSLLLLAALFLGS
ncbi:RING finger protein [Pyxidicoccus xibeiensis]|uniref:RING finger protein n=1 Tax=Pyxidicoccus xibeiensis TaxID=2906759 RepID=UPI0020A803A8|nr:RING finger protein [Pyxidicoccus xibeiensis]MCP3136268.1 hypothetical protein [Pyxidicoccus xibeiensis]